MADGMLFIAAIFFSHDPPRLYFCLSAISTTVFDVIVCLVFVSSRFDIVKKVLKVNCVPIFYSFKTPKKKAANAKLSCCML